MTHAIRLPALAGAMTAAVCLAALAPTASNEALAQIVITRTYYNGYGGGYYSGYRNGYNVNEYSTYGPGSYGYTGYGNGPYTYSSPSQYIYPPTGGYGYRYGTSSNLYYRGGLFGNYRHIYTPNHATFYSPYGYGGY